MMFKTFALTLFIFIQNSVAGATGPVINRCETVFERIQTETRNQDPEISFKRSPSIHWGDQGNYVGRLLDIDKLRQLPVSENPITMLPQTITFE